MTQSDPFDVQQEVAISREGLHRLRRGHPWIYATDVIAPPSAPAPVVKVRDPSHNTVGFAFYSPQSQIRLRLLSRGTQPPTLELVRDRLRLAIERRRGRLRDHTACRLVFGEADWLPSVVIDRYGDWLTLQTLSSGADALKDILVGLLRELLNPLGIVERNDVKARRLEGLEERCSVLLGEVPDQITISEADVKFHVDLISGQKTGFFLDQSDNRLAARTYASGRCLDCFTNTGAFALHFAQRSASVLGIDVSAPALSQARRNADLNELKNVDLLEGNVFDFLRERGYVGDKFDTICLDPPAFAKNRNALRAARAAYKEINLRAMKMLTPEGILITSSCSYHLSEADFAELLHEAAQDAHRPIQILERRAQSTDHPILLGMPETHYLKCFILRAL